MQRFSVFLSLLGLTMPILYGQTAISPHAPSTSHAKVPQGDRTQRAMASLVGRSLYNCRMYPETSPMAEAGNPGFFDGTDAQGKPILDEPANTYFHTGDKLLIRAAKTDMVLDSTQEPQFPTVLISLTVENQLNKVLASVEVNVLATDVAPGRILAGLTNNVWFSARPVGGSPEIGMSRNEVICRHGLPEQTNSDALGGDQLVYFGGKLLVYISPRTDRVINVQSSY